MPNINAMVNHAIAIANDDSHGYSQFDRWNIDRDCSSLMYDSAVTGGYNVGRGADATRYTGTMVKDFTNAGFTAIPFDQVGLDDLKRGDILVNVVHHTEMYIGDGRFVGAHSSETGGISGQPGDQTGNEISIVPAYNYWDGWDYVLRPSGDQGSVIDEEDEMYCIFRPNEENYLVYYDGSKCHKLEHPDEVEAINMVYKATHGGANIPMFELGTKDAPWAWRFMNAVDRGM